MKVLILYFSGTGNTYFIANKIYDELGKRNHDVNLYSVEKFKPADVDKYDVLVLGYPIYACDMPLFLQEYVNKITMPKTKNIILFSTMGASGANASRKIGKRLRKNGLLPVHFEEIKMPGSDGLVFMKKESTKVLEILSTNYNESENVNRAVNNILNAVDNLSGNNGIDNMTKLPSLRFKGLALGFLMDISYKIIADKLKQKLWADDKCIKCHLCENICPSHNIAIKDEKVIFSDKCYLCMRCINQCPAESIQIGKKTSGKFRWKGPSGNYKAKI